MAQATTTTPPAIGSFCWNELLTSDVDAAKKFYTGLLGWTTREMDMGPGGTYTILVNKGQDIGGMCKPTEEGVPTFWMPYISVDDVDAKTTEAQKLGAKLCHGPADIPSIGRFSVITDPTGAAIALYKGK